DGHANVSRPALPDASDEDTLRGHGINYLAAGLLDVHHELVRHGWNIAEFVLVHPGEDIIARVGHDLAAVRNQALFLQAGDGGDHASNRHCPSRPHRDLIEQVRPPDSGTCADTSHTVDLREGPQN